MTTNTKRPGNAVPDCGADPAGTGIRNSQRITIVANPGRFGTLEKAAVAENQVDWWGGDTAGASACTESFAAVEMRHFLARCLGRDEDSIHLATTDRLPETGDVFLIGSGGTNPLIESIAPAADRQLAPNVPESFHIQTFTDGDRLLTVIKGSNHIGALYGVYEYLEQLGMRFVGLGERDTFYPDKPVDRLPELDIAQMPDYRTRGYWIFADFGDHPFFLWMARNRMNLWGAMSNEKNPFLKKLGMKLAVGQHDTLELCLDPKAEYPYAHPKLKENGTKPPDPCPVSPDYTGKTNAEGKLTYFGAHPEWYGLRDGKRSDRLVTLFGDNYCTSNPYATREMAKNLVQRCIDGPWKHADVINLFMLDAGKWCECDQCIQQGSCTDRILAVAHAVTQAIKEARRQGRLKRPIQITPPAYWETLSPPTKPLPNDFDYDNCFVTLFPIERCYAHTLADPTCTETNQALREAIEGWTHGTGRHYQGSILIGEYYNVSSLVTMPVLFTRIMAVDIPWYHKVGARHFHYMHVPTRLWGTWRLNQYLLARLLCNTKMDVKAALEEYFARCYPTTSKRMRAFYRELEYAMANIKPLKHFIQDEPFALRRRLTDPEITMFAHEHLRYNTRRRARNSGASMVEIVGAMTRARQHIDEAVLACANATERERLMEDERRFAYGEAIVRFNYHLVRTAMFHHRNDREQAAREFGRVQEQARFLEGIVDLVQVSSPHSNQDNGLAATQAMDAYNFYKEQYGAGLASRQTE